MFVKIHNSYRDVIAICDEELLGKKFEEGRFQLNLKENFYKGEKKSDSQIAQLLINARAEDATFNIIGEKSVKTAIKTGIIKQDAVKKIQGVPFALVLL